MVSNTKKNSRSNFSPPAGFPLVAVEGQPLRWWPWPASELLYNFGPGVKAKLATNSLRAALTQTYETAAPALQKGVQPAR